MQRLCKFLKLIFFLNVAHLSGQDCALSTNAPLEQCTLTVISSVEKHIILKSTAPISPGCVAKFDSSYYRIEQQVDADKYHAIYDRTVGKTASIPKLGAQSKATPYRSYQVGESACFWLTLRNIFLRAKTLNDGIWLYLDNAPNLTSFNEDDPFMLSIRNPPIKGYLCVMEVRSEHEVCVYYPNNKAGTDTYKTVDFKGLTNLTYIDKNRLPPFINLYLAPDGKGQTNFVALLSKNPRPLSDFLPPNHQVQYTGWDGTPIKPWEIGPGFYRPGTNNAVFKGPDYLHGTEWSVSKLEIIVK